MIPKEVIEQITDAARIEEIVGDYLTLRRRGGNLIANCPFHNEKTPSFYVSPAKGIYKCFGCGKSGGALNFIMDHEHLSYVDALKHIARRYGITIPEIELSEEAKKAEDQREALFIITKFALDYYTQQLLETDRGRSVGYSYFIERGFSEETIKKFQLGYSHPEWDGFTKEALAKGYNIDHIVKTGLTVARDGKQFDLFRDRVIFPIFSLSGRVIAFTSRTLSADKNVPKYVNSPESEIFQKRNVLYGLHLAKKEISKKENCYLVEGNTDVISMHQAGIENVVASSGTSLTVEQIKQIRRFTNNITILYDGDPAGIKASFRGIDMILEEGMNVKVVLFPDGDDPDSYARKHSSSELMDFLEKNAQDFIDFKTSILIDEAKNDPVKRSNLITEIIHSIALIPEPISLSERSRRFINKCSADLNIDEQVLYLEFNKARAKLNKEKGKKEEQAIAKAAEASAEEVQEQKPEQQADAFILELPTEHVEREIIRIMILYGRFVLEFEQENEYREKELIEKAVAHVIITELEGDIHFDNPVYQKIFNEFVEKEKEGLVPDEQFFYHHPDLSISQAAINITSTPNQLSEKWDKIVNILVLHEITIMYRMVRNSILSLKAKKIEAKLQKIQQEIKNLDYSDNEDDLTILMNRYKTYKDAANQIQRELGRVIIK